MQVAHGDLPNWNSSTILSEPDVPVVDVPVVDVPVVDVPVVDVPAANETGYNSDGERFIPDDEPSENTLQKSQFVLPTEKHYLIMLSVSQKGKDKLVDSCGHTFFP